MIDWIVVRMWLDQRLRSRFNALTDYNIISIQFHFDGSKFANIQTQGGAHIYVSDKDITINGSAL